MAINGDDRGIQEQELTLRSRYKALRKKLLSYTPFVKRTRHNRIVENLERDFVQYLLRRQQQVESMGYLFVDPPTLATDAKVEEVVEIKRRPVTELCLFVTHSSQPALKRHVVEHVSALRALGVDVILIVNSDIDAKSIQLPIELSEGLAGCLVRQNIGYDFAAWAHACSKIDLNQIAERLYLINDSIAGPLDVDAYAKLVQRIRDSSADLVGLTTNPDPHDHLQSYYLVINRRLLRAPEFKQFMDGIVNFTFKQHVIDSYEIWLTKFMEQRGYSSAAMFPKLSKGPRLQRNDTVFSWERLIQLGFPFVKTAVLRERRHTNELARHIAEKYSDCC